MSLGPVIRNDLAYAQYLASLEAKPHLEARLSGRKYREDGIVECNAEGKLTFIPAYGKTPVTLPTARKDAPYIPFQGEHAYLNPDPKERVLDAVHQLVNPHTLVAGRYALGQRVRKTKGLYKGEGVIDNFRDGGAEMHIKWDTPTGDDGWWSTSPGKAEKWEILGHAKEEPKAQAAAQSMFGFTIGQAVRKVGGSCNVGQLGTVTMFDTAGEYANTGERVQVSFNNGADIYFTKPEYLQFAAPKIDPMKEPLKVGDRVLQTKTDIVNYDVEAVVDRIESDGTLVLKWDRNPHGDNGRWDNTLRYCFRIVERDGVPIC